MKQAFISAEDKNFYTHDGFDARGIAAAGGEAMRDAGRPGARRLDDHRSRCEELPAVGDRTIERKLKEIILAVRRRAGR